MATCPTTPTELFNGIADVFEKNPKAWEQSDWGHQDNECGTVACIAGWAVLLRHGTDALVPHSDGWGQAVAQDWHADGSGPAPCGEGIHVAEYAAQLLGLSSAESDYLFDGSWVPTDDYDEDEDEGPHPVVAALRRMAAGELPSDVGYHY